MKNTIIIHGAPYEEEFRNPKEPSPSNAHWFPWLQKQLSLRDEISVAPEMPRPYDPIYSEWVSVIENYKIDRETVLIGHSCGGGFLLRYLSENKAIAPQKVILVAPWLDPEPKELTTPFFDFAIDPDLNTRTEVHMFFSSDDFEGCQKSFGVIKQTLSNARYHEYADKGHFVTGTFEELLKVL